MSNLPDILDGENQTIFVYSETINGKYINKHGCSERVVFAKARRYGEKNQISQYPFCDDIVGSIGAFTKYLHMIF